MEPNEDLPSFKRRQSIDRIVRNFKVPNLAKYADINLIQGYAQSFGQDPNWVKDNVDFDTIMMFQIKWKQEAEYRERYDEIQTMMNNSKQ